MREYRSTNELIDSKNASQDNTNRLASEFDAMNAKQDQTSADFVAKQDATIDSRKAELDAINTKRDQISADFVTKQDAAKTPQNERFMQDYRDIQAKIQKTEADQAYLDSRKAEFDAMNSKQDQKSTEFADNQDAR